MRFLCTSIILISFLLSGVFCSLYSQNVTWDLDDSPVAVNADLTFADDDTLFIEEGVSVILGLNILMEFTEESVLMAQGGPGDESRIVFRGLFGRAGYWDGIYFRDRDEEIPHVSMLHYCDIRDAGASIQVEPNFGEGGSIDLRYSHIYNSLMGVAVTVTEQPNYIIGNRISVSGNITGAISVWGYFGDNTDTGQNFPDGTDIFTKLLISNNVIYDVPFGSGIYLTNNTDEVFITNNTIVDCERENGGGIAIDGDDDDDTIIRNNIITSCDNGIINMQFNDNFTTDNNNAWNNDDDDYADFVEDASDISQDPDYVDEANDDFHLEAGSPCIDEGNAAAAYDDLTDGSENDMGAYGGPENARKVFALLGRDVRWWGEVEPNPNPADYSIYYYIYTDIDVYDSDADIDLEIGAGIVLRFIEDVEFNASGSAILRAIGTVVNPIVFEGIDDAEWDGIVIASELIPDDPNRLTYCEITDATIGLYLGGSWLDAISNCTFNDNITNGFQIFDLYVDMDITDSEFISNGTYGLYAEWHLNYEMLTIEDSDFTWNGSFGIYCDEIYYSFDGLTVDGNTLGGVSLIDSDGSIRNSTIENNEGQIFGALHLWDSSPFLEDVFIVNNHGIGILCGAASDPLLVNTTYDCNNKIVNNGGTQAEREEYPEIWLSSTADIEIEDGHNDIYDSEDDIFMYRDINTPLAGENNYWGNALGPADDNFDPNGFVDYNPFDVAPNTLSFDNWFDADSLFMVANMLYSEGNFEDSKAIYEVILEEYPHSRAARNSSRRILRCTCYLGDDLEILEDYFRDIRDEFGEIPELQFIIARDIYATLLKMGEFEEAFEEIEDLMESDISFMDSVMCAIDYETAEIRYFNAGGNIVQSNRTLGDKRSRLNQMLHGKSWEETDPNCVPEFITLGSTYPNPFNSTTNISFTLNESAFTNIVIFDVSGRKVSELLSGFKGEGRYTLTWNAESLPTGIYICRISANGMARTQKLSLIR